MSIWDEDFYGRDLDDEVCDQIGIERVKPDLYSQEPKLMQSKWWDYRFDHPTRATYYFAHCYTAAYRRTLAMRDDYRSAKFRKGFKGEDPLGISPREAEGFWKARQFSDEHGIPYEFHVARAMEYAEQRDWQKLPRPQQLYGATQSLDGTTMRYEIMTAWNDWKNNHLVTATHPQFSIKEYRATAVQVEYQRFLMTQIKDHPNRMLFIGQLIVNKGQLSRTVANHFFGKSYVDAGIALTSSAFNDDHAYNDTSISATLANPDWSQQ